MVRILSAQLIVAALVLLAGNARAQTASGTASTAVRHLEKLTYQTKSCGMAGCSESRIVVHADGRVDYWHGYGMAGPRTTITRTKVLAASQVQLLAKKVESAGYFGLGDRYGSSRPCLGTDPVGRLIVTMIEADRRSKTIEHNYSCESALRGVEPAPSQLTELERSIPQIVGTQQWEDEIKQLQQRKGEQERAARAAAAAPEFERAKALEREGKGEAAVKAYQEAARAGSCEAAKRLGEIYARGSVGVAKNETQALMWSNAARVGGCIVN